MQCVLDNLDDEAQLLDVLRSAVGSFTVVVYEKIEQTILFLNDPLGGGLLFKYEEQGLLALGSHLTAVRRTLREHGAVVNRDYLYEISGFATGSHCHAADTPFQEISVLPAGFGGKLSRSGEYSYVDYGVNNHIFSGGAGASFNDLVDAGIQKVRETISRVVEDFSSHVLADITGGFDSRLVLAGIVSSSTCSDVTLRSISNSPEWLYAEQLATVTNMELTDFAGYEKIWDPESDFYETCVSGARNSGGIINNEVGQYSAPTDALKFQGGYGEVFRTFNNWYYPNDGTFDPIILAKNIWSYSNLYKMTVGSQQLFRSERLAERLAGRMARFTPRAELHGIDNSNMSSFWYQQGRNRYWIGQQSHHTSRVRPQIDPLYSLDLIAAAYQLDFWERRANMVGLEAMRGLDARMLRYPYYNKGVVSSRFKAKYPNITDLEFPAVQYRSSDFTGANRYGPSKPGKQSGMIAKDSDAARRLGVSVSTVAGIRAWSGQAYESLMSVDVISDIFDPVALRALMTNPPETHADAIACQSLLGAAFRMGLIVPDGVSVYDREVFS